MKVYFNDDYTAAEHAFDTTRKSASVAGFIAEFGDVEIVSPKAATQRELVLVHDPQYVRGVRTGKGPKAGSAGFGWDKGLWTATSTSTGGAVDAALTAIHEGVAGSLSSGLHHADRDGGAGFCTFNGLALAAKIALGKRPVLDTFRRRRTKACKRVLILDLDAHCGGGTYKIVKNDSRIWTIDISVCGFDGYNANSERHHLHVIHDARDYLDILELELERAAELGFDLVLYNAGMDPHEDCNIGGLKGITSDVIRQREEMVFNWGRKHGVPVAFVLAGGYTGNRMWDERLAALHGMTVAAATGGEMPDIETIEANAPEPEPYFWEGLGDADEADTAQLPLTWEESVDSELLNDLGLYAEPWDGYDDAVVEAQDDGGFYPEEEKEYKSIHDLPQEFFEIDRDDLRDMYPEFFH
jgi:acetoin utilization deacetylase AcuC-like enzyme